MDRKKLVIIGGGAAGFFCAINAARLNRDIDVVIIERSNKLLSKVKVSGGGRCNVTHACFHISEIIQRYPRGGAFLKKAFHHFFTTDTIEWFKQRGIPLKTEKDGRVLPVTDSSQTIIDCFIKEANQYSVEIMMNRDVSKVEKINNQFVIEFQDGTSISADHLCVASGGIQNLSKYEWLKKLGHSFVHPVPSLFTFNVIKSDITKLMGISIEDVNVKIAGTKFSENGPLLITHWGLSGPAILKLSARAARILAEKEYSFTVLVNWLPDLNEQTLREKVQRIRFETASKKIVNKNPFLLAERFWYFIIQQSGINENCLWADLPAKEQNRLIKNLCAMEFSVKGKTTFKEEFVTAGGVKLEEVDHNTMQSKIVPGLYFAGEVLDIDGITGGFNFQNAWSTGFIAAKSIANS
jgi:predicted Rossmann fold flavoprotein